MTANEPVQGGPYPEPTDPPDGPNQLAAIATWAAGRLVMRFASEVARDAAIPSPVEGMVAVTGAGDDLRAWIYHGTAWALMWRPTRFGSGATTVGSGSVNAALNPDGSVDIVVSASGAAIPSGTLTDVGYVPDGFQPPSTRGAAGYLSGYPVAILIDDTGRIRVQQHSGSTLGALYLTFSYRRG